MNHHEKRILDSLQYNPETGEFTWKIDNVSIKAGSIAGTKSDRGYTIIAVGGRRYRAHNLAWFFVHGVWPTKLIDHINHVRTDNRIVNLREVDHSDNCKNKSLAINNSSGHTGIHWCKTRERWVVQIGNRITVGRYKKIENAIAARDQANKDHGYHENHGKTNDTLDTF